MNMNRIVAKLLICLIIFSLGLGIGSKHINKNAPQNTLTIEKNTPKAFINEVYDKIKDNFWDNVSDSQLLELFRLSIIQNRGIVDAAKFDNKEKLLNNISDNVKNKKDDDRSKFLSSVVNSVLTSVNPQGRSGLYTQKLEEQLKNTVNNVNPQKDLYKDLGLSKGASSTAVAQAYQIKQEELKKENTPQAQEKLKEISYDKDVLTQQDTKMRYDTAQVEPTISTKIVKPGILYLQFKKFSPTSYDEFIKAFDAYKDDTFLFGLIFDLRGNIGGAIDVIPYFLGNFLGKGQYAYDFYHKGEYLPFKTPTEKLASISKYKQVVILVDNNTQSSAEIMTAAFKKFHTGVVVGVPTKGWGTVERVFPLDNQISKSEKYSLFLVHSITLRDDNQPIEGRGVDPDVDIRKSDWQGQFYLYFRNQQLNEALNNIILNP